MGFLEGALKNNARFYNGGGTNANSAIDIALKELKNESGNKSIILMSDGDVNVTDANIKLAKDNSVKIHTVGLGSGADNKSLKEYAQKTGGEHFIVKTAAGLEAIYKNISDDNKTDLSSLPDSDGDGVPDEVEQVYGIPMPDGELVFTDPEEKDTDGDGLSDGDEIGKIVIMPFVGEKPDKSLYKFLFNVKSDPTKIDTQKSQELLDYLTEELNKMMPPEYDENGNKINSHNKECDKTWNYFNEHIWIYLPEYTTSPQSRYAAYTAWLRETYGTSGLEKFWTTTDKYVDVFYDEIVNITDTIPKATKQIFYGNYSDEVTVTGTTGQIAIGFSGVDFVADIRDVTYDVDHWEWSWSHARQTGLDMIGVLPVVGILKNCDEFAALKNVSRLDADNAIEESVESINSMLKAGKNVDEIAGIERAALVNKLNKLVEADITKIAEKYENLQCVECANAIQKHLEQLDIHGVRINLQCKLTEGGNYFGNIALKSEDRIISMNGKHTAILFNNKVYDNIYPNGISYKDWKNEFDYLYPNVYAEFNEINF